MLYPYPPTIKCRKYMGPSCKLLPQTKIFIQHHPNTPRSDADTVDQNIIWNSIGLENSGPNDIKCTFLDYFKNVVFCIQSGIPDLSF